MAKKKFIRKSKYLLECWNDTYKKRRKAVTRQRAEASANSKCYSEAAKMFYSSKYDGDYILDNWKKKKSILKEEKKEINRYNYDIDGIKVLLTMDRKKIKGLDASKSGRIQDIDDDYSREIVSKVEDRYDINLVPDMYYAIAK